MKIDLAPWRSLITLSAAAPVVVQKPKGSGFRAGGGIVSVEQPSQGALLEGKQRNGSRQAMEGIGEMQYVYMLSRGTNRGEELKKLRK